MLLLLTLLIITITTQHSITVTASTCTTTTTTTPIWKWVGDRIPTLDAKNPCQDVVVKIVDAPQTDIIDHGIKFVPFSIAIGDLPEVGDVYLVVDTNDMPTYVSNIFFTSTSNPIPGTFDLSNSPISKNSIIQLTATIDLTTSKSNRLDNVTTTLPMYLYLNSVPSGHRRMLVHSVQHRHRNRRRLGITPTKPPTRKPTKAPTQPTTRFPTMKPSKSPIVSHPSRMPTPLPSKPTKVAMPTTSPSAHPRITPKPTTSKPTHSPTTFHPSLAPTSSHPSLSPTHFPSKSPTTSRPSTSPSHSPSRSPSRSPSTSAPSRAPAFYYVATFPVPLGLIVHSPIIIPQSFKFTSLTSTSFVSDETTVVTVINTGCNDTLTFRVIEGCSDNNFQSFPRWLDATSFPMSQQIVHLGTRGSFQFSLNAAATGNDVTMIGLPENPALLMTTCLTVELDVLGIGKANSTITIEASVSQPCPMGMYSPVDGTNGLGCTKCEPGTFASHTGSLHCAKCPSGTYALESGATACDRCESGHFSSQGAAQCSPCTKVNEMSLDGITCIQCDVGQAFAPSGNGCVNCTAGQYSNDGSACKPCALNEFNAEVGATVCKSCVVETSSSRPLTLGMGATSMDDCVAAPDSYVGVDNSVRACPAGASCKFRGATLETLVILPGMYRLTNTSANIVPCRIFGFCVGALTPNATYWSTLNSATVTWNRSMEPASSFRSSLCRPNHDGILCESCMAGTAHRLGPSSNCTICTAADVNEQTSLFWGSIFGGFVLVPFGIMVLFLGMVKLGEDEIVGGGELAVARPRRGTVNRRPSRNVIIAAAAAQRNQPENGELVPHVRDDPTTAIQPPIVDDGLPSTQPQSPQPPPTSLSLDTHSVSTTSSPPPPLVSPTLTIAPRNRAASAASVASTVDGRPHAMCSMLTMRTWIKRLLSLADIGGTPFKITIGYFQVVSGLIVSFGTLYLQLESDFSSLFQTYFSPALRFYSYMSVDLSRIIDISCYLPPNQRMYQSLLFSTLSPIVAILTLFAVYSAFRFHFLRGKNQEPRRRRGGGNEHHRACISSTCMWMIGARQQEMSTSEQYAQEGLFTMIFSILFSCYPGTANIILSSLDCRTLDTVRFVNTDPSVDCNDPQYQQMRIYAILMIFIYVIGIPLLFFYVLFSHRASFNTLRAKTFDDLIASSDVPQPILKYSFLWRGYRGGYYWFEVLEAVRKLAQTSVVDFIVPGQTGQFMYLAGITSAYLVFLLCAKPYVSEKDNLLAASAQFCIMWLSLVAMVIHFMPFVPTKEYAYLSGTLQFIFVAVLAVVPCCAVLTSIFLIRKICQRESFLEQAQKRHETINDELTKVENIIIEHYDTPVKRYIKNVNVQQGVKWEETLEKSFEKRAELLKKALDGENFNEHLSAKKMDKKNRAQEALCDTVMVHVKKLEKQLLDAKARFGDLAAAGA